MCFIFLLSSANVRRFYFQTNLTLKVKLPLHRATISLNCPPVTLDAVTPLTRAALRYLSCLRRETSPPTQRGRAYPSRSYVPWRTVPRTNAAGSQSQLSESNFHIYERLLFHWALHLTCTRDRVENYHWWCPVHWLKYLPYKKAWLYL